MLTLVRYAIVTLAGLLLCSCSGPYGRGWGDAAPLHKAAYRGNLGGVRSALADGCDPDTAAKLPYYDFAAGEVITYDTPLALAVRAKHAEAARELLKGGARPDPHVIPNAVEVGPEFVRIMLDAGFDPDTPVDAWPNRGGTALHWACYYRKPEIARMLLDTGADPNARTELGDPPLALVAGGRASPEKVELIRLLLEAGADPNASFITYEDGQRVSTTPLDQARRSGSHEIADLLAQ